MLFPFLLFDVKVGCHLFHGGGGDGEIAATRVEKNFELDDPNIFFPEKQ